MEKFVRFTTRGPEWDNATLHALMEGSNALGIEAWGACGLFYRPFLNGQYGPPQFSTDADIAVRTVEDAVTLDAWLREHHSWRRWSVCPDTPTYFPFGDRAITLRLGAVRMVNSAGKLEVVVRDQRVLDHLRVGKVALNGAAVAAYGGTEKFLSAAVGRARKLVREYPGLSLSGRLGQAYAKAYGEHRVVPQEATYSPALHKRVVKSEAASAARASTNVAWGGLRDAELPDALAVVQYYRTADRTARAVPPVAPAQLPESLEQQRVAKNAAEVRNQPEPAPEQLDPPEGFSTWLHFVCSQSSDATFREWLLNQSRARKPFGGWDEYLAAMLDGSLYQGRPGVKHDGEQKVTHGGWQLDQHLVASALCLATDELFTELRSRGWTEERAQQVRAGLRLGMLHHDIGKLISVNKPGAHGGASVALWRDTAPGWVDEATKQIATFVMMGHDYFGRVARAITEKVGMALDDPAFDPNAPTSYRGAMCPDKILSVIDRHGLSDRLVSLRMLRLVWEADAGSVQTLRWVLPVAPMIERILLERLTG